MDAVLQKMVLLAFLKRERTKLSAISLVPQLLMVPLKFLRTCLKSQPLQESTI
jgi:hypothetical protein